MADINVGKKLMVLQYLDSLRTLWFLDLNFSFYNL